MTQSFHNNIYCIEISRIIFHIMEMIQTGNTKANNKIDRENLIKVLEAHSSASPEQLKFAIKKLSDLNALNKNNNK